MDGGHRRQQPGFKREFHKMVTKSLKNQARVGAKRKGMPPSTPEGEAPPSADTGPVNETSENLAPARQKICWRWGILAALAMALLSLYPQIDLWVTRGANWQGSY